MRPSPHTSTRATFLEPCMPNEFSGKPGVSHRLGCTRGRKRLRKTFEFFRCNLCNAVAPLLVIHTTHTACRVAVVWVGSVWLRWVRFTE